MLGRPLIRFDRVSSTMDILAELAARGAGEGTTVVANHQTQGRGRSGRAWVAPPGTALLPSVLLRPELPPASLSPLAILVADAIAAALREDYGLSALIKWPNDVLVHGRKVSGVLIQTRMFPSTAHPAVLVGVGINANIPEGDLPVGGTSLIVQRGKPVDRDALMWRFLGELEARYADLRRGSLDDRWARIQPSLAMRGEPVEVIEGGSRIEGRLLGLDSTGALLLQTDAPATARVVVGDLTRGPRRIPAR